MSRQIQEAYIVAATRLPTAKRNGMFRSTRPDSMLAYVLGAVVAQVPEIDPALIEDVIVGCAMPEGEQGMNVARIGVLLAGLPDTVPGITINRFCSSGLQAVADAAARIRLGEADVMIAAGTESMSVMPQMMCNKVSLNPEIFAKDENRGIAYGMGLTAEKVAQRWQVSREAQDAFALASHQKAVAAIAAGKFKSEISPLLVRSHLPDLNAGVVRLGEKLCEHDEGPRADVSLASLAKLRPVFAAKGSVTAGNMASFFQSFSADLQAMLRQGGGKAAPEGAAGQTAANQPMSGTHHRHRHPSEGGYGSPQGASSQLTAATGQALGVSGSQMANGVSHSGSTSATDAMRAMQAYGATGSATAMPAILA